MKKTNLVTLLLIIYLIVMSYVGWDYFIPQGDYIEYACIIVASLFVILLLRYVLNKREGMRNESRRKRDAADRRVHRNDDIL